MGLFLLLSLVNCKNSVSNTSTSSDNPTTSVTPSPVFNANNPTAEPIAKMLIEKTAGVAYQKGDTSCMGFPRIWVDTAQGMCVGMVKAIGSKDKILRKPRALVQIPNSDDFILSDMGGWSRHLGKVVKLKKNNQQYEIVDLGLNKLSLPHTVAVGPHNKIFIGEDNQIFWFDPAEQFPQKHVVVSGLPIADGKNKHPVTLFVFDNEFNLVVNIGAPSDQCIEDKNRACRFTKDRAGLRIYKKTADMSWSSNYTFVAKGLRNSMALAVHKKSGTLLQAENAMDLKGEYEPFEEINIIEKNKHYGWPYCYNFENKSPKFSNYRGFKCVAGSKNREGTYQEPWVLLPPHSAPLGMMYYPEDKNLFPHLKGKLIVAFHGYRSTGHRIVYFDVDEKGRPKLADNHAFYLSDKKVISRANISSPYQKNVYQHYLHNIPRFSQQKELLKGWFQYAPFRPLGSPVAMTVANNGAIWFVDDTGYQSKEKGIFILGKFEGAPRKLTDVIEDKNAISYDLASFSKEIIESSTIITNHFIELRKNYLSKYCSGCHGTAWNNGNRNNRSQIIKDFNTLVFSSGFVKAGNSSQSHSVIAVKSDVRPMPLDPTLHPAALRNIALLASFIDKDLAQIKRVAVNALSVRKAPKGEKCGVSVVKNMPFYIKKTQQIGTVNWGQIVVPSEVKQNLLNKCGQKEFWIAISGRYSKSF